ncbi:hypothetical protein RD792_017002 [Penstemon davidsonii]|uniref:MACPF domain-containing protein n=1 Tax=Penstemon davidsonii TaxID=160366 RepID=A0ABR0CMP7_9LAMI|nr:hypothetical protein RD792_017002 [Penstemon davidsonii]
MSPNPNSTNQLISINAAAQVPLQLTPTNYFSWLTQWSSLLEGYDFIQFVENPPHDNSIAGSYLRRQGQLIRSALIASVSPEIVPFLISAKTSYEVWTQLKEMYATPSRAHVMNIRESLVAMTKGTQPISKYLQEIKSLFDQLAIAGEPLTTDEIVLHALHGLPDEYNNIAAALRARETSVSFSELHKKLSDHEAFLTRKAASSSTPITANYANRQSATNNRNNRTPHQSFNGNNSSNSRSFTQHATGSRSFTNSITNKPRVVCQYCDKPGHLVKQCRRLLSAFQSLMPTNATAAPPSSHFPRANFAASNSGGSPNWLVDSGASHHVTNDLQNLALHSNYDGNEDLQIGDGKNLAITHTGSTSLPSSSSSFLLNDVLYVPSMKKNLVSVYKLCCTNNVSVEFSPFSFVVKDFRTGAHLMEGKPINGVYEWPTTFPTRLPKPSIAFTALKSSPPNLTVLPLPSPSEISASKDVHQAEITSTTTSHNQLDLSTDIANVPANHLLLKFMANSISSRKETALRLRAAAEEAVQCIGLGYDLTLDLRLKYCKKQQITKEDSRLIAMDVDHVRDIAVPGGILVQNVPKSINCDKGERMRFSSDVISFQQMSEQFNQELSVSGKIPTGHFNAAFEFSGSWQKDAAFTKSLAFDGVFITLYSIALEKSQVTLRDHVKQAVPSSWDPAALAKFIEKYGTHVIVGVKMGGKDVIYVKQQYSSPLQSIDVQKQLKEVADKRFSDTSGQSEMHPEMTNAKEMVGIIDFSFCHKNLLVIIFW